jgi:gluconate 2-dehydrogenase gamma chain
MATLAIQSSVSQLLYGHFGELRMDDQNAHKPRRSFLLKAGLAGVASLASLPLPAGTTTPTPAPAVNSEPSANAYLSLGPEEAAFVEGLVNILCPADELSPSGVDCGLAIYIDRQLAGPFGQGDRRYLRGPFRQGKPELGLQLPLTPEQFFKAGIAAVNAACVHTRGKTFDQLVPASAEAVLKDIDAGRMTDDRLPLAAWFNDLAYPLFYEACFADPIYGGNRDAVFWKMLGYPGLPATHTVDMVRYRGKPYADAKHPKSIIDFS